MEMPKPTAAHDKLQRFAGKWTGTEVMHPSPWDPKGGEAQATVDCRVALDGFAVVQDYTQARDGKTCFSGHGVLSYDGQRQSYLMHWWDSMGTGVEVFAGDFEGDVLTMVAESPMGKSRATWDLSGGPENYRFKMEMSQDGQTWNTMMEGTYRKEG